MDLDRITVAIRPRRALEAVDLGFRLARRHTLAVWGAFVPVLAVFVAAACAVFHDSPALAALAIWWFKPWYDRVVLHVLSRAVFGDVPRPRQTLRALPGMFRRGALAAVLHMRFDAARSLNLAPWQLEQLPWRRWRARVRLLETPVRATAAWLAVTCVWFELTLVVTLLVLVDLLVPAELAARAELWWWFTTAAAEWSVVAAWVIAVAVIEPFYVAGGFGLYLNRRTQLESWDLEIAFRAMARRHAARRAGAAA